MEDVKAFQLEQSRLFEEFKAKHNRELEEVKKLGVAMPETKAALDKMEARFVEIDARIDAAETKAKRDRMLVNGTSDEDVARAAQASLETKTLEKVLRFGMKGGAAFERMSAEEKACFSEIRTKTLNNTSDSGGGFFVPEDFQTTVIKKIANIANVSAMVSHQATSRDVLRWPVVKYTTDDIDNSSLAMTWEDEPDTATTTDPTPFGVKAIQVKKARGLVLVDRELLEDAAVDVLGLLSSLIADKAAVDHDRQFTVGAGGKKPEGFMTNTDIGTVNSGGSGVFLFDGLMTLVYTLPEQYAGNATFMCKRLSMGLIRKLKDSQNRYLWEPSTQVGLPATLLGYPIKSNEHVAAAASASRSLIFADFKRLYMVADKSGLAIQRLDEKYADADQVGFIFRMRLGGAVIAPWAAQVQVLS